MISPRTDLAGHVYSWAAGAAADSSGDPKVVVAAATEDNVKVTGKTIDLGTGLSRPESGVLEVSGIASLDATETLTIAAELQESSDGSAWDTAVALYAATTVATGVTGGSTGLQWVKETHIKIKPRKQYIRFNITPDLSRGATDAALWSASFVGAGMMQLPQS